MTVKLLSAWGNQPPGTLYTSDANTEAAMVTAKVAIADLTGATIWTPSTGNPPANGPDVRAQIHPSTGAIIGLMAGGTSIPLSTIHPSYFCHLYAGGLVPTDDTVFTDISGNGNHGIRGANLSAAQMWATANYCSAIGPLTGTLDSTLHLPNVTNFDFNTGEALLFFWRGKASTPAGSVNIMGDMQYAYGLKVRIDASGNVDVNMYGGGGTFNAGSSANVVADGTLHDFAFFFDGQNHRVYKFVDGVLVATVTSYATSSGDCKSLLAWNIGDCAALLNATGLSCSTRTFAMLRWVASAAKPDVTALTTAVKRLRENPGRLLTVSDL